MENVENVHIMKFIWEETVNVEMILLEMILASVVKDVMVIESGTDNNVFALKGMLW